jgi:hypothetical protein
MVRRQAQFTPASRKNSRSAASSWIPVRVCRNLWIEIDRANHIDADWHPGLLDGACLCRTKCDYRFAVRVDHWDGDRITIFRNSQWRNQHEWLGGKLLPGQCRRDNIDGGAIPMMFRSRTTWLLATVVAAFTSSDVLAGNVLSNDSTGDPLRTAMSKIMTAVNGLGNCFSGTTAPSKLMTFQCWFDTSTSPPTVRYFDGTQWVGAATLNTSTHVFASLASPSGAVGGALSGTLPNPTLAPGAAAADVGALSGDLTGTLPTQTIANIQGTPISGTTGTGKVALSNGPAFTDRPRSLQSFGVDMTGATDTTAAFSTALNSGIPLICHGTLQVTSMVTVTNTSVSLVGGQAVDDCTILLTTSQSMIYLTETGNALRTSNKIRLEHIKVIPQAVAGTQNSRPDPDPRRTAVFSDLESLGFKLLHAPLIGAEIFIPGLDRADDVVHSATERHCRFCTFARGYPRHEPIRAIGLQLLAKQPPVPAGRRMRTGPNSWSVEIPQDWAIAIKREWNTRDDAGRKA